MHSLSALTAATNLVSPPCPSRYIYFQPNRTTAATFRAMFSTEKPVILAGNSHHGKAGPGQSKCCQQRFHDSQSCIAHLFSVCPRDTKSKTLQAKCPATITGGRIAILPGSSQWETSFNTWRDSKCSVALICMIPVKWEKNSNHNLDMGNVDRFTIHDSVTQVLQKGTEPLT